MPRPRKPQKPTAEILSLPRAERRRIYLDARERRNGYGNLSPNWDDYRRWDGGREPYVMRGYDALARAKRARKETDKAAAGMVATLFSRFRGLTAHRMFRRKTA